MIAIVLSLATLSSTWCGYQASQWSGAAGGLHSKADAAERDAAKNALAGMQLRTHDGILIMEYWRALRADDTTTSDNLFAHMRPPLQMAIRAAIKEGVLVDPQVKAPLERPEYLLPQEEEAVRQAAQAREWKAGASEASENAAGYVPLTLMFASVLFFGGITATFGHRGVRVALTIVAIATFLIAFSILVRLPVHWPS